MSPLGRCGEPANAFVHEFLKQPAQLDCVVAAVTTNFDGSVAPTGQDIAHPVRPSHCCPRMRSACWQGRTDSEWKASLQPVQWPAFE
jgi:hypothetical protein